MQILVEVAGSILVPELLRVRHSMCGTPTLSDLGLREHVPVVVWAETGKSAVRRIPLKIAVDPWILLVIRIKLYSITTGYGVGVFNSRHANLSQSRGRTEQSNGKGENE